MHTLPANTGSRKVRFPPLVVRLRIGYVLWLRHLRRPDTVLFVYPKSTPVMAECVCMTKWISLWRTGVGPTSQCSFGTSKLMYEQICTPNRGMHMPVAMDWMFHSACIGVRSCRSFWNVQVALTALSFFSTVVAPHATDAAVPDALWESSWAVMCATATAFSTKATRAHASVRQRFLQTLATMHAQGAARIDDADYEDLLARLTAVASTPVAGGEMWPPSYLAPLQTCLLGTLPEVAPLGDALENTKRWEMLLEWLCRQMSVPDEWQKVRGHRDVILPSPPHTIECYAGLRNENSVECDCRW